LQYFKKNEKNLILKYKNINQMNLNKQIMKQHAGIVLALVLMLMSCQRNSGYGQLTGVQDRNRTMAPIPHGMVYIPGGHFTMGIGGDDPTYAFFNSP
jgi:formylglycine-generating enzyme required for sulfatase activity